MRSLLALAFATLAAASLGGCGGTLYTSEGLPALPQGIDCPSPGHVCAEGCVAQSTAACGSACAVCSGAPAGATDVCAPAGNDFACTFECGAGLLRAGGGCEPVASVATGAYHTCAVTTGGRLKCWGLDTSGQVTGVAGPALVTVPRDLVASGVSTARGAVAGGGTFTCALVSGAIQCWGNAPALPSPQPSGVTQLSAGDNHLCALHGGSVSCWGIPAAIATIPSLTSPTRVVSGANHACALDGSTVRCWGATDQLQTGTGAAMFTVAPGVDVLAAGRNHSCAADSGGDVGPRCWGDASLGQLGTISTDQATPVEPMRSGGGGSPILNFAPAVMSAGGSFTCVSKAGALRNEDVKCFGGDNALGQLGGTPNVPGEEATAAGTLGTVALASGFDHTCALLDDGTLRCWGANDKGQLGSGSSARPTTGTLITPSGR